MAINLDRPDLFVAVIGAGAMGRGIAQVCAQAGLQTVLYDARDEGLWVVIEGERSKAGHR